MPTEFISLTPPNSSSEWNPTGDTSVDPEFIVRYSRTLDDNEFNYTLLPYGSGKWRTLCRRPRQVGRRRC